VCSRLLTITILFLVVFRPTAVAGDDDGVQENVIDLRTAKFFSRPITELELIVLNLKATADKSASFIADDKKLHIINTVGTPDGGAGFDPNTGRIFLLLQLHVDEMADPWRETCNSVIDRFYAWFFFPPNGADENAKLGVMEKYLGEAVRIDKANVAEAIDILVKSIVTRVSFFVVDSSSKSLAWMRTCTKDNLTGKISYTEYRYH
jgi:hypothetical protein